ncbi:hypothetical protein BDW02DRAFT_614286 [Decorospora gaudefroyi]|uniref:Uncharacterized protein n=1 Tax=Decorospora gaudefroyi TaxID=184978 RepID=A0A6A5JYJ7_9PLEO|nr:hypothetical protein BDW02DRAFT_614286 [Decorospora gaudefroyi]
MSFNADILNNVNLDETPLPASSYNELPHIDDMRDTASKNPRAHAQLLGLIASHGLAQQFSIHLIHKHFNIPEGRVMVYETVRGPNHPDFVLCSPREPANVENLRGLYFRAISGGKMAAFEYTTESGEDMSKHANFVAKFSQTVLDLGVQNVFALTAKRFHTDVLTEFEMSDVISTILVNNPTWLPSADCKASTSTDWIATPDYAAYANAADDGVPGIISLKCIETRDTPKHYNVTCSTTRNGKHYQQKPAMPSGELLLDGKPLSPDSEAFAMISRARALVDAV